MTATVYTLPVVNPFEAGDYVEHKTTGDRGEVVFVTGEHVFAYWEGLGFPCQALATNLIFAEREPSDAEIFALEASYAEGDIVQVVADDKRFTEPGVRYRIYKVENSEGVNYYWAQPVAPGGTHYPFLADEIAPVSVDDFARGDRVSDISEIGRGDGTVIGFSPEDDGVLVVFDTEPDDEWDYEDGGMVIAEPMSPAYIEHVTA